MGGSRPGAAVTDGCTVCGLHGTGESRSYSSLEIISNGPGSPASPCRTRSVPPSPHRPPHGTKRRPHRTPSTTRAATPLELRRSGPLPPRPTSRPRCRRSTWRPDDGPRDVGDLAAEPRPYRRDHLCGRGPRPHSRRAGRPDEAGRPGAAGPSHRFGQSAAAAPHSAAGSGQGSGRPRPLRKTGARPAERTAKSPGQPPGRGWRARP